MTIHGDWAALAREAIREFNERDEATFAARFADDAEWWPLRSETEGAYRGPDGVRAWFRETDELFDYIRAELLGPTELISDALVSDGRLHVRGKGSGATAEIAITWAFRYDGDKVIWARAYADRAQALADLAAQ